MNQTTIDKLELELREYEFFTEEQCEFEQCTETAVAYLLCPHDSHASGGHSVEAVCQGHLEWIATAIRQEPDFAIVFNRTCTHAVLLIDCEIVPIR